MGLKTAQLLVEGNYVSVPDVDKVLDIWYDQTPQLYDQVYEIVSTRKRTASPRGVDLLLELTQINVLLFYHLLRHPSLADAHMRYAKGQSRIRRAK